MIRIFNTKHKGGTAIFTRDGDAAREFAAVELVNVNVGMGRGQCETEADVLIPVPVAYHSLWLDGKLALCLVTIQSMVNGRGQIVASRP